MLRCMQELSFVATVNLIWLVFFIKNLLLLLAFIAVAD